MFVGKAMLPTATSPPASHDTNHSPDCCHQTLVTTLDIRLHFKACMLKRPVFQPTNFVMIEDILLVEMPTFSLTSEMCCQSHPSQICIPDVMYGYHRKQKFMNLGTKAR